MKLKKKVIHFCWDFKKIDDDIKIRFILGSCGVSERITCLGITLINIYWLYSNKV